MSYYRVCPLCLPRWEATVFWGGKDKRGRNGKETDKKAAGKAVIH